ncbi:MAG: hypothetical protein J0M24_19350 [Verrucomicrobia bacterium]|nr:hypothetical protein [Verrucomicrobiota bacterium]
MAKANTRLDFTFVLHWLNSPIIHGYRDGSVAENLNMPSTRTLPILIPHIAEQEVIAAEPGALDSMCTGSAQLLIPNSSHASAKALRPSPQVAEAFSRVLELWRRQQAESGKQSRTLSDTLLPKVLSRELGITTLEN